MSTTIFDPLTSYLPHSLPRQLAAIVLGVIYHSTSNREPENAMLRDHIQKNLDALLLKQPNALVVLTGDFNPTSTEFRAQGRLPRDLSEMGFWKGMLIWKRVCKCILCRNLLVPFVLLFACTSV